MFIWNTCEIKTFLNYEYNFVTEETNHLVSEVRYGVGLRRNEMVVHYISALPYQVVT
jgi:hypothetical protein